MLSSPSYAVIEASDLAATVGFFQTFGFTATAWAGSAAEPDALLSAPGAASGHLWVRSGQSQQTSHHPYARGAHALDIYTADMDASLALADEHGYAHGPVGTVSIGPLTMRQLLVHGPDGLPLVLIDANRRRSSILDDRPDLLHSQAHSLIWSVDDIEAAGAWWRDTAGLTLPMVFPLQDPEVCAFMQLPRDDVPMRMCMLSDAQTSPMRLELLEFTDEAGPAEPGALVGPVFSVADLDATANDLAGAELEAEQRLTGTALGDVRLRSGRSPHGVGFTLLAAG